MIIHYNSSAEYAMCDDDATNTAQFNSIHFDHIQAYHRPPTTQA